jgi:hypothetical protein
MSSRNGPRQRRTYPACCRHVCSHFSCRLSRFALAQTNLSPSTQFAKICTRPRRRLTAFTTAGTVSPFTLCQYTFEPLCQPMRPRITMLIVCQRTAYAGNEPCFFPAQNPPWPGPRLKKAGDCPPTRARPWAARCNGTESSRARKCDMAAVRQSSFLPTVG